MKTSMDRLMKSLFILALAALTACASSPHGGGSGSKVPLRFSYAAPDHWIRINVSKFVMFTREDPFSQYILIQQRPVEKPFKHAKRGFDPGMVPLEAAEVVREEIASDEDVLDLNVLEISPAEVNGYNGFKIEFTYRTRKGHRFRTLYYGFLNDEWYYSIRYNAEEDKFSETDVTTFQKVLGTFRILSVERDSNGHPTHQKCPSVSSGEEKG
ncbi:MAG: hypothetical protein JRH13_11375 [Deltaproteobacteria bacterium]|nr:hypothetical protein [Deltaproteobacteria bacterium]MBW2015249.1 hypothetical protein [Deltaproteobacteria bacterium]MBW2129952.1 hypothetical protein [Deltaproteobacteria bacterium]MBW2302350.1 hypothetical protein [Deltaproteobacteria bacterium]